jgi:hypothetical protein
MPVELFSRDFCLGPNAGPSDIRLVRLVRRLRPESGESTRILWQLQVPSRYPRSGPASALEVQNMLTITPRAARVAIPFPIMFRRTGDEDWLSGKVVNLSESGVLFGPTELQPGTSIEVLLSPPIQIGSLATGKQVCVAEVVRANDVGVAAVRFDECRFLLE